MENLFSLRSSQFCGRYEALKGDAARDQGRNDRETLLDSRLRRRFFFFFFLYRMAKYSIGKKASFAELKIKIITPKTLV